MAANDVVKLHIRCQKRLETVVGCTAKMRSQGSFGWVHGNDIPVAPKASTPEETI